MIDIFENYALQREELLARIAQELQLDKTRLDRMESAYNTVAELLKNDEDFFLFFWRFFYLCTKKSTGRRWA